MDAVREGSYTVEMTGIMGILLFLIFMIIYMDFDYQSQAGLRIAGYELAVTSVLEDYSEENYTAQAKKNEMAFWKYPTVKNVFWQMSSGAGQVEVNVNAESMLGKLTGNNYIRKENRYKKENPISWIRNMRMLNKWGEMVQE